MVGRRRGSIETAETDLWFDLTGQGLYYFDIAQSLSLVNRKMYRQGMQYAIQDLEMFSNGTCTAFVYRLPLTWVVANSWEKCMRNWMEQEDDTLEEAGLSSLTARYRDFKVFMDANHAIAGVASNALPLGWGGDSAAVPPSGIGVPASLPTDVKYDWTISEIVIPNDVTTGTTTERTFHMLGEDTTATTPDSVSMIKAYAESRSRPHAEDPNTVQPASNTGGILGEMFDVGDDDTDIIFNAREKNNSPPYPVGEDTTSEFYPGGSQFGTIGTADATFAFVGLETVMNNRSTAAISGNVHTTYSPGFLANCGLLAVQISHGEVAPSSIRFKIGLHSGDYKGIAARSMAVVN